MAYDLLVTGACGFLGSQIVKAAINRGLHVLATDRAGTDQFRLISVAGRYDFAELDVTASPDVLDAALVQTKAVVHCAAYGVDYRQSDLKMALHINVLSSVQIQAAAARAGARYIHIGTSYEYGPSDQAQDETFCPAPRGIYGVSKLAGSVAVLDRASTNGGATLVVRPFGMYGPLEGEHKLVPQVMRSMLMGEALDLTPCEQIRDYVYVSDVAQACVAAVTIAQFPAGKIINLGSGIKITLRDFVEAAARAVDGDLSLLHWGGRPYRPDEVMYMQGTCAQAEVLLGWQPTTSLAKGMAMAAQAERLRMHDQQNKKMKCL